MVQQRMTDVQIRQTQLLNSMRDVCDPEIGRTLGQLDMLKQVELGKDGVVHVEVELPTPAYPKRERIAQALELALRQANVPGADRLDVAYSSKVRGKNAGG